MTRKADYGQVVSTKDALLIDDDMLPSSPVEEGRDISPVGNAMWSYRFEGRINGVPVAEGDRNLPIDREDLLNTAFEISVVPRSAIFWMSPDDEESIKKYDGLLAAVADGSIAIVDELKQYDAAKSKFMVWVRYNELSYRLHRRFEYLREEAQ